MRDRFFIATMGLGTSRLHVRKWILMVIMRLGFFATALIITSAKELIPRARVMA
ncbi:uncharacterized protein CC84DRAFT_1166230 [Paraphaeosphaeria sporulosa]|uniref:Uncharacterized protein n=1 Tax=Paraphaeosphaeria sporulosa TaxID=1460663 RepID=A0A177C8Z6_9PLEO|nr:uncharacterized protein CC84DRAFT_1166230 [Paraphaeosphaeria sporulosa]OAG04123.1 hypothetical protein CC84DRAFT_1166230 [Paraphaeosphaeria sporulosa]